MRDTPDGDGSLLDHSAILFGSGMGDGNLHRHNDLPVLMAGKLHGKFQTGYRLGLHTGYADGELLVTMLDHVGVRLRSWATVPGNCCSTTSASTPHARGADAMTVFRCITVAVGLLCASASLVADGPGLVDAARNGNLDSVRSLLKSGADPNQAAPDGSTAVHWAVHGDNLAMLNALLDAGAKPNSVTRYRIAPLTLAAQNGNAVLVERLLDAGANPDTASEEGQTALMTAARNGSVAAVRALLKRGAQIGLTESFRGQTALMFAAGEGNADAATLLIEFGAKLNERSKGGYTPLLFAVRNNRYEMVKFLLEQGATSTTGYPTARRRSAWRS
jgi:ankyrin repeat protein